MVQASAGTPRRPAFDPGTIVHITPRAPADAPQAYHHKHACEVVDVYLDWSQPVHAESDSLPSPTYAYRLSPVTTERTLPTLYRHSALRPSPRGYGYITGLLDPPLPEDPPEWERTLGKFMRADLEAIDTFLSVVDFELDPTKDWLRELRKGDIDRTNSIFAEMLLLYYLRVELGRDAVTLNADMDDKASGGDVDIRATTADNDLWIEVYKPDFVDQMPEETGFLSPEWSGTAVGNKLRAKFDSSRAALPEDAVIILAVYLVEPVIQGLGLQQWLDEEYFAVSEYCDGILTFTHFGEHPEFTYYGQSRRGTDCEGVIESTFTASAT